MSFRTICAQCGKKLLVKHLDDLWFCNQVLQVDLQDCAKAGAGVKQGAPDSPVRSSNTHVQGSPVSDSELVLSAMERKFTNPHAYEMGDPERAPSETEPQAVSRPKQGRTSSERGLRNIRASEAPSPLPSPSSSLPSPEELASEELASHRLKMLEGFHSIFRFAYCPNCNKPVYEATDINGKTIYLERIRALIGERYRACGSRQVINATDAIRHTTDEFPPHRCKGVA